jgi:glyoxylate reductase
VIRVSLDNEPRSPRLTYIVDVNACSAKGIQVANIQSVVDAPTADTAMFLILSCLRQFQPALQAARSGEFNSKLPLSSDPGGKTLGILGLGGIGKALAKRAQAFGMIVSYHNRNRLSPDEEARLSVRYVETMDELFETSDVLSIHVPLSSKTRHLVSSAQFKMMKASAVMINTARGPIIDQAAMVQALAIGAIAGVGLDVYEDEPHIPSTLLSHPKAVCLPHVGTMTVETQAEMEAICMRNLIHALETGNLPYVVQEQK